ncbi:unnamed protein product [Mytilus edulis]|uniref:Uncharacterized protein n=1 Tax=Mytilus edulis TaxID=6550 RepID=A0A8S3PXX4_MYTED|nr:unnamed protein product [Mytilus edulis]
MLRFQVIYYKVIVLASDQFIWTGGRETNLGTFVFDIDNSGFSIYDKPFGIVASDLTTGSCLRIRWLSWNMWQWDENLCSLAALFVCEFPRVEVKKFLDLRIDCVITNLDNIEQGTVKYQSDINEAISAITEDGNQMKQWIDQKVQALITSLEEKGKANLKALQSKAPDFQNDLEKLQKCQTAFIESQKLANVTERLTQLKHIKSELRIAVQKQLPVMSTVKYYKKDVSEQEISILFGELSFRSQSDKQLFRYQCDHCCILHFLYRRKIKAGKQTLDLLNRRICLASTWTILISEVVFSQRRKVTENLFNKANVQNNSVNYLF